MNKYFLLAPMMFLFVGISNGQATRTWVSGVGDDVNPCSRTAPCKTFAGTIGKTATDGEINCLDPGGFGSVSIVKSITIDCQAAGGILAAGVNGITVNSATANVRLRNLSINGAGTGFHGINILTARSVELENVAIFNFATTCVNLVTASTSIRLRIENSSLSDCPSGVVVQANSAVSVNADLHNTRIWDTTNGVVANNGARVNIRESVISHSLACITQPFLVGGMGSTVNISNSTVSFCGVGLISSGGGVAAAFGNTFSNNQLVFNPNGGTIQTGQDNVTFSNVTVGTATSVGKI